MRNESKCVGQTWPYTYMGFKDQKWSKGAHLSKSRFWRRREEKREKRARAREGSSFGWVSSHFLAPL